MHPSRMAAGRSILTQLVSQPCILFGNTCKSFFTYLAHSQPGHSDP